jgi:hypothetical protein
VSVVAPSGLSVQLVGIRRSAPAEKLTVPDGFDLTPASVSTTVAVTCIVWPFTTGLTLNETDVAVVLGTMVILADAVPPGPDSVAVTAPVVLFFTPAVVEKTLTEKLQLALAARAPPVKVILPEPGVAVIIPSPHVPVSPFGVATTKPAGRLSVNPTPLSAIPLLGLFTVKLNVVV